MGEPLHDYFERYNEPGWTGAVRALRKLLHDGDGVADLRVKRRASTRRGAGQTWAGCRCPGVFA